MKMRKILKITALVLVFASLMTATAAAATIGGGTVNATQLNLRSQPTTSSRSLALAPDNASVAVTEKLDGWYKVLYNGMSGYMSADYIEFSESYTGDFGKGSVKGTTVRIRQWAGYDATIIGHVNTGDTVSVKGITGEWYYVDFNGTLGYIHSDYVVLGENIQKVLDENKSTATGNAIVDTAMKYLGCPYVWGGNGPSSFDCSGLVKYVYGQHGYSLYRTADDQATQGESVSRNNLKAGDVLCFGSSSYISHVGIYIGNDEFIHASTSSTGVIISDLNSDYYTTRFVCGRRFC